MLEKPPLQDEEIISCIQDAHELPISTLTFLPGGTIEIARRYDRTQ